MIARWNALWFARVDARSVAAMRISLGVLLVWFHLSLWPDLALLFTDAGPVDLASLRGGWTSYRWSYLDGLDGPSLHLAHAAGLVVLVCFTLGVRTRAAAVLALVVLVATWHRSPWIQNGGDRLLRLWTLYMALVPAGAAWSVDAWRRRRRGEAPITHVPAVAHRLIQLQLIVMYLYTGIDKLRGPAWWDGTAVYWAVSNGSFTRSPELIDALAATGVGQAAFVALTWFTLVVEIGFAPLVLFRKTRPYALIGGVLLHTGIFSMMCLGVFSFASMWGYLAFLPDGWVDRFQSRVGLVASAGERGG